MNRRSFIYQISVLSAGIAMSCKRPELEIFPAVDHLLKYESSGYDYYKTYIPSENGLYKLLVKVFEHKPIQILPQELSCNDASNLYTSYLDSFIVGDIYNLYNSRRFWNANYSGKEISREEAIERACEVLSAGISAGRRYILLEDRNSPALNRLIALIQEEYPDIAFIDKNLREIGNGKNYYVDTIDKLNYYNALAGFDSLSHIHSHLENRDKLKAVLSDSLLINTYNISKLGLAAKGDCINLSFKYDKAAKLNIPKSHFLESWADGESAFGEYAVQQAVVNPLNPSSFSDMELLFTLFKILGLSKLQEYDDYYSFLATPAFTERLKAGNAYSEATNDTHKATALATFSELLAKSKSISNKVVTEWEDNPYNIFRHKVDDDFIAKFFRKAKFDDTETFTTFDGSKHKVQRRGNYEYLDKRWGLVIDLRRCNGCNLCVSACRIENNIPIPSEEAFDANREMDWVSIIESKFAGRRVYIPYMCQHCENAPCEAACPVNATVHSPEGLNEMVYNRCVGTRYCMAACQYRVRRFNYRNYWEATDERERARLNPRVTVRTRGVVEKCSLCVQKINEYEAMSENEQKKRKLHTACSEICPLKAIKLVDLNSEEFYNLKQGKSHNLYRIIVNSNTKPSIYYIL